MDAAAVSFAWDAIAWETPAPGVRTKTVVRGGKKLRLVEFGRDFVEHCAQELHDAMRFRQVNAGRADLLPEIGNGIEPDESRPSPDVRQQRAHHRQQDGGILEIQVHLISAERGPHVFRLGGGRKFSEQR